MLFDLIALGILALFVVIGLWRGVLASGAGLVSLLFAYSAAALGAQSLGGVLSERFALPSIVSTMLAGSALFAGTYLLCSLLTSALKAWDRGRRAGAPRSGADRLGGAFFGLLRGGLIVLLLSVLATWLDAAKDLGVLPASAATPEVEGSRVSEAAGKIIEGVVEKALAHSDAEIAPAARMMVRIATRPGPTIQGMQGLLDDDRVRGLQNDKLFWTLVENGAGERAINQASFYGIVQDPQLRGQMADLGLVSPEAALDPGLFRRSMADMLSELGPRIKGLRNDPEVQRLARDPEIMSLLQSGDTLALIAHPDIQKLASRVASAN